MDEPDGFVVWISHASKDWHSSPEVIRFAPERRGALVWSAAKQADGNLVVTMSGLYGQTFAFRTQCPVPKPRGIAVAMNWAEGRVTLHLNGVLVAEQFAS